MRQFEEQVASLSSRLGVPYYVVPDARGGGTGVAGRVAVDPSMSVDVR